MKILQKVNTIRVIQAVCIDQLFTNHQMSNCNHRYITIVQSLCLALTCDKYVPDFKDVSIFHYCTRSIQWLASQIAPDIL